MGKIGWVRVEMWRSHRPASLGTCPGSGEKFLCHRLGFVREKMRAWANPSPSLRRAWAKPSSSVMKTGFYDVCAGALTAMLWTRSSSTTDAISWCTPPATTTRSRRASLLATGSASDADSGKSTASARDDEAVTSSCPTSACSGTASSLTRG